MRQRSDEKLRHVAVYIPVSLYAKLDAAAKAERRSISSAIVILLEKALKSVGK